MGLAVVPLGDQNGDGVGALAIGQPGQLSMYGGGTEGEIRIFDGQALVRDVGRGEATTVLTSRVRNGFPTPGDGWYLATGDLTGDGHRNLIRGGPGYIHTYVLPLPLPTGEHMMDDLAVASVAAPGGSFTDFPAVGDVTGDGILDLSLSGKALSSKNGGVSVHAGHLAALDIDPMTPWASYESKDLDDAYEVSIGQISGRYTPGVVSDIDGDGRHDVVVGGERLADLVLAGTEATSDNGGLSWFRGGSAGAHESSEAQAVVYGECSGGVGGFMARVGDVTGDCRPDLALGDENFAYDGESRRGAIYIASELHRASGQVSITDVASAIIVGEEPGRALWSAGSLGDLNQDGCGPAVAASIGSKFSFDLRWMGASRHRGTVRSITPSITPKTTF